VPLPPFGLGAFQDLIGDGRAGVLVGARDEDALDCVGGGWLGRNGVGVREGVELKKHTHI
jgi:hypothetical protein